MIRNEGERLGPPMINESGRSGGGLLKHHAAVECNIRLSRRVLITFVAALIWLVAGLCFRGAKKDTSQISRGRCIIALYSVCESKQKVDAR